jgi:hypothetical protein
MTIEDPNLLQRFQDKGIVILNLTRNMDRDPFYFQHFLAKCTQAQAGWKTMIMIKFKMENQNYNLSTSRNAVAELLLDVRS